MVKFVPQQEAWVIERFGKFSRVLTPGLNVLIPFVEEIKYVQSLKEITLEVPSQSAVTQDNVTLHLDGVLYLRVVDPYKVFSFAPRFFSQSFLSFKNSLRSPKASYGVQDAEYAVAQLAQTTMRSEIGKMALDQTFKERKHLNVAIVEAMNSAASDWGIDCLRYEIRELFSFIHSSIALILSEKI